jgi:hypothetical protein
MTVADDAANRPNNRPPPGGGRSRRRRRRKSHRPTVAVDLPLCPICQKAVRELHAAISHRETGQPAHFDCILQLLRDTNDLQDSEKICYLGKGSFGIVQFRQNAGPMRFLIRKRIQYEQTEGFPAWRRSTTRSQVPAERSPRPSGPAR